ncbi:MAG TPA: hypothetical protein VF590_27420 [Isosphaeraceae bacterium]|jgi:hypothetical protein
MIDALRFAYAVLRHNFSDPEAHRVYIGAMIGCDESVSELMSALMASPGMAVRFTERNIQRWVVIEEEPGADAALNELGSDHPLAKELAGKRVGESFILKRRPSRDVLAIIEEIKPKYVYRFQDTIEHWNVRFPEATGLDVFHLPTIEAPNGGETYDFADFFAMFEPRQRHVREVEAAFLARPMPIHLFAEATGNSAAVAMLRLAVRRGLPLRCCRGHVVERIGAEKALRSSNVTVMDLTAACTLLLLGLESLLERRTRRVVVSQSTMQELRSLAEKSWACDPVFELLRVQRDPASILTDSEQPRDWNARVKTFLNCPRRSCDVRGCLPMAALDPKQRKVLTEVFGQHGVESMILGAQRGHVLWTDDLTVADVANSEFGAHCVWTGIVLGAQLEDDSLDGDVFLDSVAKLVGFGYDFTGINPPIILRAAELADWNPDRWPLEQVLDQFANVSAELCDMARVAAATIVAAHERCLLVERRQALVIRIAERLGRRRDGMIAVQAMVEVLPQLFGLDVVHAREATTVLKGWLAEARRRPMPYTGPSIISWPNKRIWRPDSELGRS